MKFQACRELISTNNWVKLDFGACSSINVSAYRLLNVCNFKSKYQMKQSYKSHLSDRMTYIMRHFSMLDPFQPYTSVKADDLKLLECLFQWT